jgi:hypothetical protein
MELTTLLERMKMEHLLAQLDGVCEQAAKGDLDFKGFPARRAPFGCAISRRTPTCAGPGGSRRRIVDGEDFDRQPVFSPSGDMIYFLSDRDGARCVRPSGPDLEPTC